MDIRSRITAAIWRWGTETPEQIIQAVKEISEVGYKLFESTKAAIYAFDMKLEPYREIMKEFDVAPASFYFHLPSLADTDTFFENIEAEMCFVAELGVKRISLQATEGRSNGNMLTKEQLEGETALIRRFAEKSKEYGITSCLHPHYNTWAMYEPEIDFYMQNIDAQTLSFCPDTAHLIAGGCDPVDVIKRYVDRVNFTHFKDIKNVCAAPIFSPDNCAEVYSNFCELGKGNIDFRGVFDILKEAGYEGPLCEELDRAPVSNIESARNNFEYLLNNY